MFKNFLYLLQATLIVLFLNSNTLLANNNKMLEKTLDAVVSLHIETDYSNSPLPQNQERHIDPQGKRYTTGSGFFISNNGIIITNAHVIQNAKTIVVTMNDGREAVGYIVGMDRITDIGIIQIPVRTPNFLSFLNTTKINVGDKVYAIGNAFGLSQSVTQGIISAVHRGLSQSSIEDFIQTDTPINMGNSGGPLINTDGELVGVSNMIMSVMGGNNGVGFAIPSYIVKNIASQIIQFGSTKPGQLGVISQTLTPILAKALQSPSSNGTLISQVLPNTPAEKAEIKAKDIITEVNGIKIETSNQLRSIVYTQREGSTLNLKVISNGKNKNIKVTTSPFSNYQTNKNKNKEPYIFSGVSLVAHESIASEGNLIEGLRVIYVAEGTPAWLSGLYPNDIITKVNDKEIKTIQDISNIKSNSNKTFLIEAIRASKTIFIAISHEM